MSGLAALVGGRWERVEHLVRAVIQAVGVRRAEHYREVVLRADPCCYCGASGPGREPTVDHVVPLGDGGSNSWENLTGACRGCNHAKGDMSLLLFLASRARLPVVERRRPNTWTLRDAAKWTAPRTRRVTVAAQHRA